jgi:hypothetical protein
MEKGIGPASTYRGHFLMDITQISNRKSVDEFASYIRTRFQGITQNWLEIAAAFAEAKEMYGTGSGSFKDLCKRTRFSESTITKLISIINFDRLKEYAVQFSSVHSWGTLYAISTLTEEQFETLKADYKLNDPKTFAPFITQADVERYKKGPTERSIFRGYAVIQVDDEAVKGGLLTGVEFEELQRLLEKMETMSEYVAVKRVGNEEKEELSRLNRIENKFKQLTRKRYLEGINAILARYHKMKGEKDLAFVVRILGRNRDEAMAHLAENPKEAFEYLSLEYDVGAFYNEAQPEVSAAEYLVMDRYAKKVMSRPPVVNEPEYDEAAAWKEANKLLAKNKHKVWKNFDATELLCEDAA